MVSRIVGFVLQIVKGFSGTAAPKQEDVQVCPFSLSTMSDRSGCSSNSSVLSLELLALKAVQMLDVMT